MPTNLLDYHYRSFTKEILPILVERGIGTIGMKSLGGTGTRILKVGITAQEAISYALSLPIHTLVSGMDSLDVVTQNLEIVRNWRPLTDEEQDQLLERITPWAIDGRLEHYKTVW
jgi:hypothetical protein